MATSRVVRLLVRIILGLVFLVLGGDKIFGGQFTSKGFLAGWITEQVASGHVAPFYRPFLETIVAPNDWLFAWIIAVGEFALGIALISGVLLRIAAVLGALEVAMIGLASAMPPAGATLAGAVAGTLQFLPLVLLLLVIAADAEVDPLAAGGSRRRGD
jgi:thiosulfate dehydrogenase [quinone] large subunit